MAARQRDPDLVERYRHDPRGTVEWWESERANVVLNIPPSERSTWLRFFLPYSSHCSNAIYDEPPAFQRHFAARLGHSTLPYPDISS